MGEEKIFLVFNTACFGDALLCNTLCQNIKINYPDSKIVFICDKPYCEAVKFQQDVDEVVVYDKHGKNKGLFGFFNFIMSFPYKNPYCSFITYLNYRNILIAKFLKSKHIISENKNGKAQSAEERKTMDARVQVYSDKMQKADEFLEADFAPIRAGRANPHVLDKLRVDYYGTPTPIQQVGNVTVPEARIIQIAPWEKSLIKEIEKAIMTSDIGINPSNDGSVIRLVFPEITEERRKDLVKEVKKMGEEGKVAIRNIRRDGNDAFKKLAKTEVSEDEIKGLEDDLQKLTDKYVKDIDALIDSKSKEIMTV